MGVKPAMKIYRVGGYVRDRLLGVNSNDCDYVVVGATPDDMIKMGFKQVGKSFPVFLSPKGEEYALARREMKSGKGYIGFDFDTDGVTLEDDLKRRDLTINAIAEDFDGNLIDPFGGVEDIQNGTLRHVSPAFVEDPVRVLRVARLRATLPKNFSIADETIQLIQEMKSSGELKYLQQDRVRVEVIKTVERGDIYTFFQTLDEVGVLDEIFPYLRDYSILKTVEVKSFQQLTSILSLSNPLQEMCKHLKIGKKVCRTSETFQKSVDILNSQTTPEKILELFRLNRLIENLRENIELYNSIYPDNKIQIEEFEKLFQKYRDIAKEVGRQNLPNGEVRRVIQERWLKLFKQDG